MKEELARAKSARDAFYIQKSEEVKGKCKEVVREETEDKMEGVAGPSPRLLIEEPAERRREEVNVVFYPLVKFTD